VGEMIGNMSMHVGYDRYYIDNIDLGKVPVWKHKHRYKDYIKSGLKEMELEAVNLLCLAQDKFQ
jgi:hypothetical protein